MKLRLRHNSVRLRLTQGEVTQLRDYGSVEEHIEFGPGQRLSYRIVSSANESTLRAEYRDGEVVLSTPAAMVADWADSSKVGMEATGPLRVLIEKDFECLAPSDPEDNRDTFPNPQHGKSC